MSKAEIWNKLEADHERLKEITLKEMFLGDAKRFKKFHLHQQDILMDFSKERIDESCLKNLFSLAENCAIKAKRDAMFNGEAINATEGRSVLHIALRNPDIAPSIEGVKQVENVLNSFLSFAETIRKNTEIKDIISIGIGGSDLGPQMAAKALSPYHNGPKLHFVSNVDGAALQDVIKHLNPLNTLVIIQSKTFTTDETMTNAQSARDWLLSGLKEESDLSQHLAAVSTNIDAAKTFGVAEENIFGFWDWVGGRYSIWSAIGLPLAIAIGEDHFRSFLQGGAMMDNHFKTASMQENLPILMGLISVWRRNFMHAASLAVIPYDERLSRFPAYLQQLIMESNGKSINMEGKRINIQTSPVIWGEAGTNAQHSFFQMLHQGTDIIPIDFLVAANPHEKRGYHHEKLLANCFAQSKALAFGKNIEAVKAEKPELFETEAMHRVFEGNRPSTTLIYPKLTPEMLGKLIALYEHKTFVEAAIWDINAFDQWGVELGKILAKQLLPMVQGDEIKGQDTSTQGLIEAMQSMIE